MSVKSKSILSSAGLIGRLDSSEDTARRAPYYAIEWKALQPDLSFHRKTGLPIVLNTSFNQNEPIVCTPEEALDCFCCTRIDVLAIGPFLVVKRTAGKVESVHTSSSEKRREP